MLNKEYFILLAGDPKKWDDEVIRRTQRRESLIEVQRDQHARGRLSAKLLKLASGWAVVDSTGLEPNPILFKGLKTRDEAIEKGRKWAEEDPKNREFIANRRDMEK